MAIQSRKNQYIGVNAHLMSILQTRESGENPSWRGFHNHYIARIMELLNAQLPSGYIAVNEESLQVLGEGDDEHPVIRRPVPDVTLYKTGASSGASAEAVTEPTWQAIVDERPDSELIVFAAIVYQQQQGYGLWGKPITRIELLSSSNKRGGSNYVDYSRKRRETFLSGLPLVEIDLLHESRSPIAELPIYPKNPDAHAYSIAISDPRPSPSEVRVAVYGFDVDNSFPTIPLPLAEEQVLPFDAGVAFNLAYETGPWRVIVDYEQLPVRFETYSEADQARIKARMQTVQEAQQHGANLDDGPFVI